MPANSKGLQLSGLWAVAVLPVVKLGLGLKHTRAGCLLCAQFIAVYLYVCLN